MPHTPQSRSTVDNTVVSALHQAGALARVFGLWPGRWVLPDDVRAEAAAWPAEGPRVTAVLERLRDIGVVEFVSLDVLVEGRLYADLQRVLGRGESAAIAVAFHRGVSVVLDDRRACRACEGLNPPVAWTSTEGLLGEAVSDGLLPRADAEAIWTATGIKDPNRWVP